ncbi:VWA domain-containing protein [Treponema sp.]
MNFSLERPLLFIFLLAALALALFIARILKSSSAFSVPLGPPGGPPFSPPVGVAAALRLLQIAEILGVFCLILAASGPVLLSEETVWLEKGADVLFVIDASPSMSALDMNGLSRFETAKKLLRDFASRRGADAIGLVAVGEDAALLIPPSIDREALYNRLDSLQIAELGDGTALGLGLSIAALHLRSSRAPRKATVLITDGENNTGAVHPVTAAAAVRASLSALWVIGVGSTGEVAIDYVDPETRLRRTGVLDSRFNPEALKAIASAGAGVYLSAPSPDSFARAFSRLDSAEPSSTLSRSSLRIHLYHTPFILLGLILLVLCRSIRRLVLGAFL